MFQIPVDNYLAVLRTASAEEHPFKNDEPALAEKLGPAFAALAHGVADFVEAGRETIGYETTLHILEDMVHSFPSEENYEDPFVAALKRVAEGLKNADGAIFTEADLKQ